MMKSSEIDTLVGELLARRGAPGTSTAAIGAMSSRWVAYDGISFAVWAFGHTSQPAKFQVVIRCRHFSGQGCRSRMFTNLSSPTLFDDMWAFVVDTNEEFKPEEIFARAMRLAKKCQDIDKWFLETAGVK